MRNLRRLLKLPKRVATGLFVPRFQVLMDKGETIEEAKQSLKSAVQMVLDDRLDDVRRGLPEDAIEETISIP